MIGPALELDLVGARAFEVDGIPRPQGRKSAITRHGRTVVVESGRKLLAPWRDAVTRYAAQACSTPLEGPVRVELEFRMPRPKAHYRTIVGELVLRDDAPRHHAHRPDADKLARAVLDALTGPAFGDDGQVAELVVSKVYDERAGVRIVVSAAEARP